MIKSGNRFKYTVLLIIGFFSFAGMMGPVLAQQPLTTPPSPATAAASFPAGAAADTNRAVQAAPSAKPTANAPDASATAAPDAVNEDISRFCANIDSQASEARFQLQSQQLQQLRAQIDERIKVLEEKRQDYQDWLNKRNAFLERAQESLVGIITKMRPDAAAAQLALVDDITAASIILKLTPKASSIIMNELPAEKSASLTRIMVSMQRIPQENEPVSATANTANPGE